MEFLRRIEPYITTDDFFLREFLLWGLEDFPNIPVEWSKILYEQAIESEEDAASILSQSKSLRVTEEALSVLIKGAKQGTPVQKRYFKEKLMHTDTKLALKFKDELKPLLPSTLWKTHIFIDKVNDEEELYKEFGSTLALLNSENFNYESYLKAKLLADALIDKDFMDEMEIEAIFRQEEEEIAYSSLGMLGIYMAGKMRLTKYIPLLAKLLASNDDLIQEEACDALISFQSDEAVNAALPYAYKENSGIYAISVLKNIKTKHSLSVLRKLYKEIDQEDQELVFEALCQSLSAEALPEIEEFNENGQIMMVDYEQNLYGYYTITGTPSPYLQVWKRELENQSRLSGDNKVDKGKKINLPSPPIISTTNIGRNDHCPCNSGKKYKKCCGK